MGRKIDIGKIAITPEGEWLADRNYEYLSFVQHNGSGYLSLQDNENVEPGTDENVWMLASKGGTPELTSDEDGNIYADGKLLSSTIAEAKALNDRIASEEQERANAEQTRVASENIRIESEGQRVNAETGRKSAESSRVSNEESRKRFETQRLSAETERRLAENNRVENEAARLSAENQRISAERARVTNENARIVNERNRQDAEAARAAALANKQDKLISGENIKTLNGKSLLGEGNIDVGDEGAVRFVSQNLTNEQKAQARTNIEAYKKPASGIPASDIASDVIQGISNKQDAIADLSSIRSGAALGSTSVQPADIENMVEAEPIGSIVPPVNPSEFATKVEISQLQQEVDGYDADTQVAADTTVGGFGINQANGQITSAARADYSVRVYKMDFGKSYHIVIPKLTNAYTAAYVFLNSEQAQSPDFEYGTLPSPVVKGPLTDYEADVTEPTESLSYLVVCYETAYGVPTVTTQMHTDGISKKVVTLEGKTETIEREMDSLQEEINEIITDTDNTLYENEGQVAYYRNINTKTGWNGVGTATPELATDVTINRVVFPPFMAGAQGSTLKFFIGHRVYGTGVINTPETALTKIAEGTIENVGTSLVDDFAVNLQTPVTIPFGNQLIILLYNAGGYVYILGGGNSANESAPFNSDDARAFLITTSGYTSPFEQYWSIANATTSAQYKVCNPVLKYVKDSDVTKAIQEQVPGYVEQEVSEIVPGILESERRVSVYLPNKLYAVVGDALQLFFQGIVGVVNIANYDIYVECSKGRTYPRYFHYKPTSDDIGTTTLTVYVKDRNNNILGQASCDLVTVSAPSSPVSAKSIFTFGDSLTGQGQWPGEAKRRLVGNSTYDSITGNGLSNIAFYGYMNKTINGQSVDYFGVGGWAWGNYLIKGTGGAFRFFVSGVSSLSIGAVYSNNGFSYTIQEINVTGDSGNIRCTTSANTNTPSASGTLTKESGDGDATITFASYETENANPLWDDANNKMSFIPYVQDCGASTIDAVYVLLSWNGQGSWKEYSVEDATGHIANAKTFARTLHTEYPSAKLFIMGIQMPSDTGGLGYNYGASGGLIDGQGVKQTAFNYNKALQDLCNLDEFSPYCEFVAVAPQFDSHYNMPYSEVKVNTRNAATEMLGTNGVHPSNAGYFQIADAVYRSIVANFCQP